MGISKQISKKRSAKTSRYKRPAVARSAKTKTPKQVSRAAAKSALTQSAKGSSKQEAVLGMLRQSGGTTITAIIKATGWQQHSVRGFFAGVVKKRLKLNLVSDKVGDERVYRIAKPGAVQ
jgi:hypothetical protein